MGRLLFDTCPVGKVLAVLREIVLRVSRGGLLRDVLVEPLFEGDGVGAQPQPAAQLFVDDVCVGALCYLLPEHAQGDMGLRCQRKWFRRLCLGVIF